MRWKSCQQQEPRYTVSSKPLGFSKLFTPYPLKMHHSSWTVAKSTGYPRAYLYESSTRKREDTGNEMSKARPKRVLEDVPEDIETGE